MRRRRLRFLWGLVAVCALDSALARPATSERGPACGTYPGRRHLERAIHLALEKRAAGKRAAFTPRASVERAGNLALIEADDSIVSPPNPFDLRGTSLALSPLPDGRGYRLERDPSPIEPGLGDPVVLADDATLEITPRFEPAVFGTRRSRVFLNSDGNLTFERGDNASTARSLERFLSGPPRIALFFADLDPSAGGELRVANLPERLVVTWQGVPEFDKSNQNTFQVAIEDTGRIVFRYSDSIDAGAAVVGISPGGSPSDIRLADLSAESFESSGAIAEKFQRGVLIDDVALARRFYGSFPDLYDSLVVWTSFPSDLDGAFAFSITTQNEIRGIGEEVFNDASLWGSTGRLQSYVFMGNIDRYPTSPDGPVSGAAGSPTTLGLLAHEVAHRWLARVRFDDAGRASEDLLGRQLAHWSFFMDTDASFLEGNDIEQQGENRFRTVGTVSRYSLLDLYLMGFASREEVAPLFFVKDASGLTARGEPVTKESSPEPNVALNGSRRDLLPDDILRAEGERRPDFASAQKEFRQAWILLYREAEPPSSELIARIETIRAAWEPFFRRMSLGRAGISTFLEP